MCWRNHDGEPASAPVVALCYAFCLRADNELWYRLGPYAVSAGRYTRTLANAALEGAGRRVRHQRSGLPHA